MPNCLYCGKELPKRGMSFVNKYCDNRCQANYQSNQKRDIWLTTGKQWKGTKSYILEIQKNRCAVCGSLNIWQDKTLVFVLDHIDGDSTNNWRSNLRCVCPNCDSQLPTFKSKNKGKGRHSRRVRYTSGQSY